MSTFGTYLAHVLKSRAVDTVFGIPGVHNQEMYRGLAEAGVTHILARHEQGAGFMADGYARSTGRPGVALVISGPGLTNIMTPLGQSYSDSVPVLVISSCLDETAALRGQLHQMRDQRAAAETVCDWSEEARSPAAAVALIDRALIEFAQGRKRPKHIQVPIALLEGPAPSDAILPRRFEVLVPPADPTSVASLATRLLEANRPLFVFGGGASTTTRVTDVLDRSGAAAFMTYAGRGVVPSGHPRSFGSLLGRPDSADLLASSDCVVYAGTDAAPVDFWRDHPGHNPGVVWVNTDPEVLAAAHPEDTTIHSDLRSFIPALADALEGQSPGANWDDAEIARTCARWKQEVAFERPGIAPVAAALQDVLPPETMIYSDMTQFAYAVREIWDLDRPGHWHHPNGFGTLGYSLPAGIGAAVARPGAPMFVIIGDYGLQFTMPELATAAELGLSLPIFVWDNAKLGEIQASMTRAQIEPTAVLVRNPDFALIAKAYGLDYAEPTSLDALQTAVWDALQAPRPTFIRMRSDTVG